MRSLDSLDGDGCGRREAPQLSAPTPCLKVIGPLRHGLTHLCVCIALLLAWPAPAKIDVPAGMPPVRIATEGEIDAALRRAALSALGGRDGAILLMDAQTGRLRALAGRQYMQSSAFPPGSAIKPFTLLTALRASLVDADTRLLCRKHYRGAGAEFTCAHPVFRPRFGPIEALAHSCNYFFAHTAERMRAEDFAATLSAYGFGPAQLPGAPRQTHHAEATELAPRIPRGDWRAETALGEGGALLVTPLQMIAAYAALFNGGRLFEPRESAPENFLPRERTRLRISDAERALLLAGMRGAVRYGTAERARLDELPLRVFGKTGTATEVGGFRTHGWFVGFASDATRPVPAEAYDQPASSEVKLVVLVFLKRAQGKECATLAQAAFAEYARLRAGGGAEPSEGKSVSDSGFAPSSGFGSARADSSFPSAGDARLVRVRLARDGAVRSMPLDEYLFGVLAAEASAEDEYAALKAQTVVSRTYALGQLSRHARDNFDFCTTTHCQRYLRVSADDSRPDFHALLRRAVAETAGEVLRDSRGELASTYFSANCGGMTADVHALWGVPARAPFERGVRDEFCVAAPDTHWRDVISARQLAEALRADPRGDVGATISDVRVVKRDATGRAELVEVRGERRVILRGWDFKIIVGRTLGWAAIKSSRFMVERVGDMFVFRGTGFGHGLGLCQAGAHAMARGGSSYRQILAHYFPGAILGRLSIAQGPRVVASTQAGWRADATAPLDEAHPPAAGCPQAHTTRAAGADVRLALSSEHFRVSLTSQPDAATRRDAEAVLRLLEAAHADLRRRLEAASLVPPSLSTLEVNVNGTTAEFVAATGQPSWVAAATRAGRVELQPLLALRRRRVLEQTLRHEYAHAVLEALSRGRAPRWLAEGLAAHFAGEGLLLSRYAPRERMFVDELERRLCERHAAAETRALYAAAYREVFTLIRSVGEPAVWRRAAGR